MKWTVMTARLRGEVVVINLAWAYGERDEDELSALIVQLLEQGFRIFLLNLVRSRCLAASEIGGLVRASRAVTRKGGNLGLLDPQERVRHLLAMRLASRFDVFTSEDEAVRRLHDLREPANMLERF